MRNIGFYTLYFSFIFVLVFFSLKSKNDINIISKLRNEVYLQSANNDDLRYQLTQCRMLYRDTNE